MVIRVAVPSPYRSVTRGIRARAVVESLLGLPWNRRSLCCGIRARFAVESAFDLAWNTHIEFWRRIPERRPAPCLPLRRRRQPDSWSRKDSGHFCRLQSVPDCILVRVDQQHASWQASSRDPGFGLPGCRRGRAGSCRGPGAWIAWFISAAVVMRACRHVAPKSALTGCQHRAAHRVKIHLAPVDPARHLRVAPSYQRWPLRKSNQSCAKAQP